MVVAFRTTATLPDGAPTKGPNVPASKPFASVMHRQGVTVDVTEGVPVWLELGVPVAEADGDAV